MRPPLLMPGMNAICINPKHQYHMFTGIVQRVTDGKAQVLFEGGNWDKSVTFRCGATTCQPQALSIVMSTWRHTHTYGDSGAPQSAEGVTAAVGKCCV
jgi:hypothetical protein